MTAPAPGQLVEVRSQNYVVLDTKASSLPPDPIAPRQNGPQHLISLSSLEEDSLGEEIQVIWELEPGTRILEGAAKLPSPEAGFDDPARFDAFLNAIRWGAISAADDRLLQAPFRSGITREDYQMEPLVRALQMPRANLLIADDVGLGKTIETGLVIQELIIRHRARSVLIVCPASLQYQWQSQMREKFGLDFVIVDSALMKDLRRRRGLHVNPWTHHPRLITSIDYLKRERPMRLFREVLPGPNEPAYPRQFDLLVVDEAHNVAPSGTGNYATDSQRTLAIRTLARHFEHKLFLTATPHNGYLLDTPGGRGVFNAVAPAPVTHLEMQRSLARTLRRPLWLRVPAFALRACLGEMAQLLVDGQRVIPAHAMASGFSFRYPQLQGALDHLIGAGARNHDAAPAEIYYNGECPVCRAEMSHYAKVCGDASIRLQFIDATKQEGMLAACGLRREHLERRLYLCDVNGRLLSGMPALIELWSRMPGYRWLSVLLGAPLLRQLSSIAYDQVIAPGLAFWARRRARTAG